MKSYRFEAILGVILLILVLLFNHWQAPGSRLTPTEIDERLARIDRLAPLPVAEKRALIEHLRAWARADDGKPVYNLNLMRYYPTLRALPGADIAASGPAEANAIYEATVLPKLLQLGVSVPLGGSTQKILGGANPSTNLITFQPELDNWSRVLVVRYPSRRAFLDLVSDPEYLKVMPYKLASLLVVLAPFDVELMMPEPRLLFAIACLMIFLAVGWWRSSARLRRAHAA